MPRRLLRCLTTGAGGRGDKRQNDTQQEYPPRVAQEHAHSSVPPPKGPVRVFAPLLPPAPIFGVQFISGVLLLTNLLVPLATVRRQNQVRSWMVGNPETNACLFVGKNRHYTNKCRPSRGRGFRSFPLA